MSKRIIITQTDDLTGETITTGEGGTVTWALNGIAYEIDLTSVNQKEFLAALEPYLAASRRVGRAGSTRGAAKKSSAGESPARAWAIEQGLIRADRRNGRLPKAVLDAYAEAGAG